MAAGDWWTMNLSPWSGCKDLALPPEQRAEGCRRCWLPSLLSGPRGRAIHGDHPPHEIVLHPGRLAQALRKREPQRYGWINGEVADVATDHPEYLAACAGVALASPDHGFGVPTSDPGPLVTWARNFPTHRGSVSAPFCRGHAGKICGVKVDSAYGLGVSLSLMGGIELSDSAKYVLRESAARVAELFPPPNWIWLISASTQREVDERLPHALELARMGWRWGWHLEPLIESVSVLPDAYGMDLRDAPAWVVSGAPKGHNCSPAEVDWHRQVRDQAAYAGVPYWLKSLGPKVGRVLDGSEHNGLPAGWPGGEG